MLSIGMDITIVTDRNGMLKKYRSKIADLYEEKLCIYYPLSVADKKPAFLPAGSKVLVHFIREDSTVYSFESEVIGVQKGNVPLVELFLPEEKQFNKVQRREYVRVNAAVKAQFNFPDSGQKFSTVTSDISAGGCAVIIPPGVKVKPGESGTVTLSIEMGSGEQNQLSFTCEIIRTFSKNKINYISLKYIEPSQTDQQLLIRYCFERQLSDRRKGLHS